MSDQRGVPMRPGGLKAGDVCGGQVVELACVEANGRVKIKWEGITVENRVPADLLLLVERPEPPLTPEQILEWLGAAEGRGIAHRPNGNDWGAWNTNCPTEMGATASEAVRKAMGAGHE